jgi:hypothetical protein
MPTILGREITLADLASHRSGLPRLPGNLILNNRLNPYAEYSVAQPYEFLAGLTNCTNDVEDIALHLINRAFPLAPRPIARRAIDVPADVLARYVGEYQYLQQPTVAVTLRVTLENGGLMLDATGLDKSPILAESEVKFFATTVDAQFTFVTDAAGAASGLVLHRPRFSRTVKKVR